MTIRLAAYARGRSGMPGHPLVFLHGLTFDHQMWAPVVGALPPGRPALALDLPGHGASPALPTYDLDAVTDAVHAAVLDAELEAPVLVGHSQSAIVATRYAVRYAASGIVNVDAALDTRPLQFLAPALRDAGFEATWARMRASMHIDRVAPRLRWLLAAGDTVDAAVVLGYWAELLDTPPAEMEALNEELLGAVREREIPYLALYAATRTPEDAAFLQARVPHAEIVHSPARHHFPHLADPDGLAARLTTFAAAEAARR